MLGEWRTTRLILVNFVLLVHFSGCGIGQDQFDLRLIGGKNNLEGRVEVFLTPDWTRVCGGNWDLKDAEVVCRELGLGAAVSATTDTRFGRGNYGSLVYDNVRCNGDESRLLLCHLSLRFNCNPDKDAGVVCEGTTMKDGVFVHEVRLVDGSSEYEGFLEVYFNQQWGTVCDIGWDKHDADVVCEELGFDFAVSTSGGDRLSSQPIWLSNVRCTGNENRLADCFYGNWDVNDCTHDEDVWVVCNGASDGTWSADAIIGVSVGGVVALMLLSIFSVFYCDYFRGSTFTCITPAASRTQIPANEANTATPVIHYHPAQQSVSVAPSMLGQSSAPTRPANMAPPPFYETVAAQPTMFPSIPSTGL